MEIKKRNAHDQLFDLCRDTPKVESPSYVINYGRFVTIEYSTYEGTDFPNHAPITVKVWNDSKLMELWSGNVGSILTFISGKKTWKYHYPNESTSKATIKYLSNGFVELTMKERSDYGGMGYRPYRSSPKTILSDLEWSKVIEVAKLVKLAADEIRKHNA